MTAVLDRKLRIKARFATSALETIGQARADAKVDEFVRSLVARMGLPAEDASGTPQAFHAYLERDGRHLSPTETVGDALQDDDEIVLRPDVQAGAAAAARG